MNILNFLDEMEEEKRSKYIDTLRFAIWTERNKGKPWRFSQTLPSQRKASPFIPAEMGHINKLEAEGIIEKTFSTGNRSKYKLAVSHEALTEEIKKFRNDLSFETVEEEMEEKWEELAKRTFLNS